MHKKTVPEKGGLKVARSLLGFRFLQSVERESVARRVPTEPYSI